MSTIDLNKIKKVQAKKEAKKSKGTKGESLLNKEIQLFGKGASDKDKIKFYQQLSILLEAGVDIKGAIEVCGEETKKKKLKKAIGNIQESIVNGESFSEALEKTEQFSNYEYFSLKIGEETGQLKTVLKQLVVFYKNRIKQKRLFVSALSYPLMVLLFSFGAVIFMLKFIVPIFTDVFQRFGNELPAATQMVIQASNIVGKYFLPFLLISAIVTGLLYAQRKTDWFRKITAKIVCSIPVLGKIIKKLYTIQLCQGMALMIESRVPILQIVELQSKMIDFYPINEALEKCKKEIFGGALLYESLSKNSFFDSRFLTLVKVGEASNCLGQIFKELADAYLQEVEYETGILSNIIEPILIIFIGLIVGAILIAMYLPMFQLSNGMGV